MVVVTSVVSAPLEGDVGPARNEAQLQDFKLFPPTSVHFPEDGCSIPEKVRIWFSDSFHFLGHPACSNCRRTLI